MNIYDPDGIFPDHEILVSVLHSHPFLPGLDRKISTLTLRKPLDGEGPQVNVDENNVILTICTPDVIDDRIRYILFHEFGHIADRFDPSFEYSEQKRNDLPDTKHSNFMEIWNLYIDARLKYRGLYRLIGHHQSAMSLNGKLQLVDTSVETKLYDFENFLSKRGFRDAFTVVKNIWENPLQSLTFPAILILLNEHMD